MRYKRKPLEIEAIKWVGDNLTEVQEFIGDEFPCNEADGNICIQLPKHQACGVWPIGSYIVKYEDGSWSVWSVEAFRSTFEAIKEGQCDADC